MTGFTPGPWEYSPHKRVIHGDGKYIAGAYTQSISAAEREANARLIAAAPDMYEALSMMIDAFYGVAGDTYDEAQARYENGVIAKARAAIAKAEGKT